MQTLIVQWFSMRQVDFIIKRLEHQTLIYYAKTHNLSLDRTKQIDAQCKRKLHTMQRKGRRILFTVGDSD